ncbi:hypothetical protein M0R19_05070 [Candidatus Pacearchaeota archaeon]|jgi:hypothetical protein|nr:hypothetical protein [Candidatus Pacearchaeota archaeon]
MIQITEEEYKYCSEMKEQLPKLEKELILKKEALEIEKENIIEKNEVISKLFEALRLETEKRKMCWETIKNVKKSNSSAEVSEIISNHEKKYKKQFGLETFDKE